VLTVPLVCCFRAEFPEVAMRIVEGFSGHILEWERRAITSLVARCTVSSTPPA
jgi:hypothetical protein